MTQLPLREENARQSLSQTPGEPLLLASCFQQVSHILLSLNMMLWQNSTAPSLGRRSWQFTRRKAPVSGSKVACFPSNRYVSE